MADAAPSGGSSWGPFEIIIALVLAMGVLNAISGKNTIPTVNPDSSKEVVGLSEKDKRCGLSVISPVSLEKVSNSIRLEGSVSGCRWNASEDTALYAQVITGGGVPVSEYVAVVINNTDEKKKTFNMAISLKDAPTSGTGYVLLLPAVSEKEAVSVRIPVRFVRQ